MSLLLLRVFGEFILLSVQPVALATSVLETLIPRPYFRASHTVSYAVPWYNSYSLRAPLPLLPHPTFHLSNPEAHI